MIRYRNEEEERAASVAAPADPEAVRDFVAEFVRRCLITTTLNEDLTAWVHNLDSETLSGAAALAGHFRYVCLDLISKADTNAERARASECHYCGAMNESEEYGPYCSESCLLSDEE